MLWSRIFLLFVGIVVAVEAFAQVKIPQLQQVFSVVHTQQINTEMHIAQAQMLMQSDRITQVNYTVESLHETGYQLKAITTYISGKMLAWAQEQSFNSNDTSGLNNDELKWIKNLLNIPVYINVVNNHAIPTSDTTPAALYLSDEDAGKYFFSVAHPKLGYNWIDSTHTDSSKIIYQYLISKITADSIAITVYADMVIRQKFQQNNTGLVQQLKGILRATRWYNTKSGVLKTEESNTLLTGSTAINGSKIPVRVTIKSSLKVEEKR
ncbi:MAG: hypothetical protein EAZ13_09185 [Sphingobacteriia bacterium]|nr:MAG: hypothetical protein EAZ41_07425 [Sphingobacteriia bacterium]TAG31749.1 MAG: hypothetical protein EAZ35_01425 [Sphingobacteriia bacterium]TAH06538.1 MAG: hypothetical protein EAZ13_09185 [Sphingobacteriia bacterium]